MMGAIRSFSDPEKQLSEASKQPQESQWRQLSIDIPKRSQGFRRQLSKRLRTLYADRPDVSFTVLDSKIDFRFRDTTSPRSILATLSSQTVADDPIEEHSHIEYNENEDCTVFSEIFLSGTDSSTRYYQERIVREENRFLVAEGNPETYNAISFVFNQHGEVTKAYDADDTIELYKRLNPDVVVIDINARCENGGSLISQLRRIDPHAFTLVTSTNLYDLKLQSAKSIGASAFLRKPIKEHTVMERLYDCVTLRNIDFDDSYAERFEHSHLSFIA